MASDISEALKGLKGKKTPSVSIDLESDDSEDSMDESSEHEASPEQVELFKAYQEASGPEEKAMALKAFIKCCDD